MPIAEQGLAYYKVDTSVVSADSPGSHVHLLIIDAGLLVGNRHLLFSNGHPLIFNAKLPVINGHLLFFNE